MQNTIDGYDLDGAELAERYQSLPAADVHAAISGFIPDGTRRIALDIGAGSGRDAAWLRDMGYDVVAVEPSLTMRTAGKAFHPDRAIHWLDDQLPSLTATHRLGLSFDVILLSGVFMHVRPQDRPRAFRKIVTLLRPGGRLLISVRDGPCSPTRPMWPVPQGELEACARDSGLTLLHVGTTDDLQGRKDVRWTTWVLQLPDDGTGALPRLRGIILDDEKAST